MPLSVATVSKAAAVLDEVFEEEDDGYRVKNEEQYAKRVQQAQRADLRRWEVALGGPKDYIFLNAFDPCHAFGEFKKYLKLHERAVRAEAFRQYFISAHQQDGLPNECTGETSKSVGSATSEHVEGESQQPAASSSHRGLQKETCNGESSEHQLVFDETDTHSKQDGGRVVVNNAQGTSQDQDAEQHTTDSAASAGADPMEHDMEHDMRVDEAEQQAAEGSAQVEDGGGDAPMDTPVQQPDSKAVTAEQAAKNQHALALRRRQEEIERRLLQQQKERDEQRARREARRAAKMERRAEAEAKAAAKAAELNAEREKKLAELQQKADEMKAVLQSKRDGLQTKKDRLAVLMERKDSLVKELKELLKQESLSKAQSMTPPPTATPFHMPMPTMFAAPIPQIMVPVVVPRVAADGDTLEEGEVSPGAATAAAAAVNVAAPVIVLQAMPQAAGMLSPPALRPRHAESPAAVRAVRPFSPQQGVNAAAAPTMQVFGSPMRPQHGQQTPSPASHMQHGTPQSLPSSADMPRSPFLSPETGMQAIQLPSPAGSPPVIIIKAISPTDSSISSPQQPAQLPIVTSVGQQLYTISPPVVSPPGSSSAPPTVVVTVDSDPNALRGAAQQQTPSRDGSHVQVLSVSPMSGSMPMQQQQLPIVAMSPSPRPSPSLSPAPIVLTFAQPLQPTPTQLPQSGPMRTSEDGAVLPPRSATITAIHNTPQPRHTATPAAATSQSIKPDSAGTSTASKQPVSSSAAPVVTVQWPGGGPSGSTAAANTGSGSNRQQYGTDGTGNARQAQSMQQGSAFSSANTGPHPAMFSSWQHKSGGAALHQSGSARSQDFSAAAAMGRRHGTVSPPPAAAYGTGRDSRSGGGHRSSYRTTSPNRPRSRSPQPTFRGPPPPPPPAKKQFVPPPPAPPPRVSTSAPQPPQPPSATPLSLPPHLMATQPSPASTAAAVSGSHADDGAPSGTAKQQLSAKPSLPPHLSSRPLP